MKNKLIKEITFTLIFMIIATIFVYIPKDKEFSASLALATNMKSLSLETVTDDIKMDAYYPVTDEQGKNFKDNIFKIVNKSNKAKNYSIEFKTGNENKYNNVISNSNIRYSYKINDGEYTKAQTLSDDGIISIETINANSENTYYFKLWISTDDYNEINGKIFQGIIELNV